MSRHSWSPPVVVEVPWSSAGGNLYTCLNCRCTRQSVPSGSFFTSEFRLPDGMLLKEDGEVLRGAYLEAGAALAAGVPVMFVGEDDGCVTKNGAVLRAPTIDEAFWRIFEAFGLPDPPPRHWPFPPPSILTPERRSEGQP